MIKAAGARLRHGVTSGPPIRFSGVPMDMIPVRTLPPVVCRPVAILLQQHGMESRAHACVWE